ncbi:MAG TPA: hypothetical protein VMZ69_03320 [Saprospiraceae bacterium]|nr:hypothetical protein [Saprospiraceae bacterium]
MRETSHHPLNIKISTYFALFGGILIIVLETIRRWHQLTDIHFFPAWFDDYLAGGFLIFAAIRTMKSPGGGLRFLTAAWGFATGMMYYSFFIQLSSLDKPDPSSLPATTVVFIKGILLFGCIANLILSLLPRKS